VGLVTDSGAGLDAEKLDVLRNWGRGLRRDERQEVAAAGRAILLLIEEIEHLHVELWGRRLYPGSEQEPEPAPLVEPLAIAEPSEPAAESELATPLRERLRRFVGRAEPATESTGEPSEG
jgi:hypothetical protein